MKLKWIAAGFIIFVAAGFIAGGDGEIDNRILGEAIGFFKYVRSFQSVDYDVLMDVTIDAGGRRYYEVRATTRHEFDGHMTLNFPSCPSSFTARDGVTGQELVVMENSSSSGCDVTILFKRVLGKGDFYTLTFRYVFEDVGEGHAIQIVDEGLFEYRFDAKRWGTADPWNPRPTLYRITINLPESAKIIEIYGKPTSVGDNRLGYTEVLTEKKERFTYGAVFSVGG